MEQKRINLYQELKKEGLKKTFQEFVSTYFSDEAGVEKLWNSLVDKQYWSSPLKDFYLKFACDLNWAKTTKYCGAVPQKQDPVVKKQEPVKAPEPVRKQVNVSDLDPQYQPNVQYIIPNKNTSNVQPNQPNKAPDKVTFTRITNPNDD